MTKEEAVYGFLSGFDLPAWAASQVPEEAELPYLTYGLSTASFGDGETALTVDLWFRTEGEAIPDEKAAQLVRTVGRGGVLLRCEGGGLWLKRGSPLCQRLADPTDPGIKRRCLNLTVEYLTEN